MRHVAQVARLKEELARQRRLAEERVVYNGAVAALAISVDTATEVTDSPPPLPPSTMTSGPPLSPPLRW